MPSNQERSEAAENAKTTEYLDQPKQTRWSRFVQWFKAPETSSDVLLVGKAVVAATAAWAISVGVLGSEVAFMAPWTALLTVHATVHRSLSRGAQTTASSAIGMGLAFVILYFFEVNIWTFALALLVGLFGARLSWIRDEGVAIATTAIFIFTAEEPMFLDRTLELLVGVGIGIVVNLAVVPPLQDKQAARYVDSINRRMGAVLVNMADEFSSSWGTDRAEAWLKEADSMSEELNSAWQVVRLARESRRENPRAMARRRKQGKTDEVSYEEILKRVDEAISHLRNLTRTLREATYGPGAWDEKFRSSWVAIAYDVGSAVADPDDSVEPIHDRLTKLSTDMSETADLPAAEWPVYGALITSLRHIVVIVDDVASARESRDPSEV